MKMVLVTGQTRTRQTLCTGVLMKKTNGGTNLYKEEGGEVVAEIAKFAFPEEHLCTGSCC